MGVEYIKLYLEKIILEYSTPLFPLEKNHNKFTSSYICEFTLGCCTVHGMYGHQNVNFSNTQWIP